MGAVTSCVQGRFGHRSRRYEEIKRPEYRERVYALASEIARMYGESTPPGTILGPSFTVRELPGSNSIFTPTGYQPRGVYTGPVVTGSAPPHAEDRVIQQRSSGVEASPSPRETTNDTSEDSATLVEEAGTLSVITNPDPPAYPRRTSGVAEILATLGLPQREFADRVQDEHLETEDADVGQTDHREQSMP